MPVYFLTNELIFPHPSEALEDGLLALGGDLTPERLLLAYKSGIFPWFSEGSPILWWSPDPRMVLLPEDLKVTKSLTQSLNNADFTVRKDTRFREVIDLCAKVERKDQDGTWITKEMQDAYIRMHESGYAHSFETYYKDELVGGLYGLSIGKAFFGESMFHLKRDASKIALVHLVEFAINHGFYFIYAQQETDHLKKLGAKPVSRSRFLNMLDKAVKEKTTVGPWTALS